LPVLTKKGNKWYVIGGKKLSKKRRIL
jgi:hypothetical protein